MSKSFISIKNISKSYQNSKKELKKALKDVSLDIFEGEIIALLGVNGAGKTTLSSILASLHPPTSGDVIWNGKSIYKDIISYRKEIGFCPQKPNLDKLLSIEENLYFSGTYYGLSKKEIEARTELLIENLSLSSYRKSSAEILSGGYKQRFLIARTLMHNPKFVILDEPTVGLDAHIRRQLWDVIKELKKQGITVLLTTHYLDEAEVLSDRVCFIHEGKIYTIDSPENLKKKYQKSCLEDVFLQFLDDSQKDLFQKSENVDE